MPDPMTGTIIQLERLNRELEARLRIAMKHLHEAREYTRIHATESKAYHDLAVDLLRELNGDLVSVWRRHAKTLKRLGYTE